MPDPSRDEPTIDISLAERWSTSWKRFSVVPGF
jgi:hypothetical protein